MGIKMKGEDRRVWCFVGDMCAEGGAFYEAKKYAHNFDLPLCFVVESNEFSTDTPTREVWGIRESPPPLGQVRVIEEWPLGGILFYRYERIYPHVGCGIYVRF